MNNIKPLTAPIWIQPVANLIQHLPAGRYRLMNMLCRWPSAPFWMQMATDLGGLSFQCDLSDSIAREVCFTGRYEPQETALIQALFGSGLTFVDVGANWGYYTLLAAHLAGQSGCVVSFEPDPRLFPVLERNLAHNNLSNVVALQFAIAEKTETLTLAGYDEKGDNKGLSRLVERAGTINKTFEVQARPLDTVLNELGIEHVDFLKMDIEGAEEIALKGMADGLARHRYSRVLLEIHPALLAERGRSAQDVIDLMVGAGYSGWQIDFSPAASRKAAYARSIALQDFLSPLSNVNRLDAWPHVLWLAPDVELP